MSSHIDFLRGQTGADVRVAAQGNTLAVVLTADELLCGRAGFLGRFGARLDRYPLARLSGLEMLPNPSASVLTLRFAQPDEEITVLFPASERHAVDQLVGALKDQLQVVAS